jgi:hypothetical protein
MKRSLLVIAVLVILNSIPARADLPGAHPGLNHALNDLRQAQWILQGLAGQAAVDSALNEINQGMTGARILTVDEGQNSIKPSANSSLSKQAQLQQAQYLLQKAAHDLSGEVDRPQTRNARQAINGHIQAAQQAVNQVLAKTN